MPTNLSKIVIPTGYESQQRAAERKRSLAEALLKMGLQTGNYNSWTQVAGQMANALAGKLTEKKAAKLEDKYYSDLRGAYDEANSDFDAAVGGGMSGEDLIKNFSTNPFLEARLKPYAEGLQRKITESEEVVKTPDNRYMRQGELLGKGPINDPNAAVVVNPQGDWLPNMARMSASLGAQGFTDANTGRPPNIPFRDPMSNPPAMPAAGGPAGGGFDINLFTPEEQKVMFAEVLRRRQQGGPAGVPPNQPYGSPLTINKPPAGVTSDGKPYWIINGVPYDNPEGR